MKILVTGAAGFIGFHSSLRLLALGHEVVGLDNINDYYDVELKNARLRQLKERSNFSFLKMDLADRQATAGIFKEYSFDVVLHLGAQAGVRYSIDNPFAYVDSNISGTLTILEGCRCSGVRHVVYASSSSVYGANTKQPFSTSDRTDSPVSLYAATKKSNELMFQAYANLYQIRATGLRFFTVYGPWGRPDMAYFKFAEAILEGRTIDVYNNGDMERDFTYIDDVVNGIQAAIAQDPPIINGPAPHNIYNIGNRRPERLMDMIRHLERHLESKARVNFLPMQPGDVYSTYADIEDSERDLGYAPTTRLEDGIAKFAAWYSAYRAKISD